MSIFSLVEGIPYKSSAECQKALAGIEAIDYFFARQIIYSHQHYVAQHDDNEKLAALSQQASEEVFHILLALSEAQRKGSVCLALDILASAEYWSSEQEVENSQVAIDDTSYVSTTYLFSELAVLQKNILQLIQALPTNAYIVLEKGRLYSKRYWHYENNLCRYIAASLDHDNVLKWQNKRDSKQQVLNETMSLLFPSPVFANDKADLQQIAVLNALSLPFSIITGGAGTGKTYTISRLVILISIVNEVDISAIEMAAPTGKAANRMASSLAKELDILAKIPQLYATCEQLRKLQPKTINRLLKTNPTTGISAYSAQRPMKAKLLIIDETSMIDISLMNKLIESVSADAQVVLVGDPNQLPSVETGCLLADLVRHPFGQLSNAHWHSLCKAFPALSSCTEFALDTLVNESPYAKGAVNRLLGSRRNSLQIDAFATAILNGNVDDALSYAYLPDDKTKTLTNPAEKHAEADSDVNILLLFSSKPRTLGALKSVIRDVVEHHVIPNLTGLLTALSPEDAFDALSKYALLTPFRQSIFGSEALNHQIEAQLQNHYAWVKPHGLYKCKPIMVLHNDYHLSLFNGDVGIIWEGEDKQALAYFNVENKLKAFPVYNLPAFSTNYAMTIHKTQGSEFESVDILLPHLDSDFLNRQLLYTGVTRAKTRVNIFTSIERFTKTVLNAANRVSGIESKLSETFDENELKSID